MERTRATIAERLGEDKMSRPKKDLQIRIANEIISMREGESRTINIPTTLTLTGGVLYITQPDVVRIPEGINNGS